MYGMLDLSGIRFPCRLIKQFFFGFLIKYHLIFTWFSNKTTIFFFILVGILFVQPFPPQKKIFFFLWIIFNQFHLCFFYYRLIK